MPLTLCVGLSETGEALQVPESFLEIVEMIVARHLTGTIGNQ